MPRLRYAVELRLCLVQLCFKYEAAGKCHRKFPSSGDERFETSVRRAKIVTTATVKENGSYGFEGT
jgi:hypothetical protein